MHRNILRTLALLATTAASATAQIPEGWAVVSKHYHADGLFAVSPRVDAPAIPIQDVPDEIKLTIGVANGASAVAIHPSGALIVGNWAGRDRRPVVLFILELDGFRVSSSRRIEVGQSFSSQGTVTAIDILPDGRAIFSVSGIYSSGPLRGFRLGLLDVSSGQVRALGSGVSPTAIHNTIAVDPSGDFAYLGVWTGTTSGDIYRVPLRSGLPTRIGSVPGGITGIAVRNDGKLVVGMNNVTPGLGTFDPATATYTPTAGAPRNMGAVVIERATGNALIAPVSTDVLLLEGGQLRRIGTIQRGVASGIDLQQTPRTYGAASPGANTYTWRTAPNPGGIPTLGNSNFSLTLDSSPAAAAVSLLLVSTKRADVPLLGVRLQVDPAALTILPIPSRTTATIPLPIPNQASIAGVVVHCQTVHEEVGGRLATSSGLTVGAIRPN